METELHRSQVELKLGNHPAPYFMSYQMKELDQYELVARYGALFEDHHSLDRKLGVSVRVGSYQFDNSVNDALDINFSIKGTSFTAHKAAPIDDDRLALRKALWLVTDEKYKNALFNYLKKTGQDVYSVEDSKRPPSFSRELPAVFVQPPLRFSFDHLRWAALGKQTSQQINAHPELFDSEVKVTAEKITRLLVSTEGTRIVTEETLYGVHVSAVTRAPDGQLLDNSRDYYSPLEAGLPTDLDIHHATETMMSELLALRAAPAIDPYTGPALLEPEAAGVLFHEAVGHRLEGERQDNESEGKMFRGQVGKALLPSFLSIYDDPTLRSEKKIALNGYYLYDEEGVRAQRVALIEKGVLKNYLMSRHPIEGFLNSNGHGRSQGNREPTARMANLIIESSRQFSDADLKKQLIVEAKKQGKPYGLIIRNITGGDTNTSAFGYQAFKGVPRMAFRVDVKDGSETLVRGIEMVGTPLLATSKVIAAGRAQGVFNGFCGAESGYVPVSTVAPAILLQEVELERAMEGKDRPPVLPSP